MFGDVHVDMYATQSTASMLLSTRGCIQRVAVVEIFTGISSWTHGRELVAGVAGLARASFTVKAASRSDVNMFAIL
jgi:hypothetical protein